MKITEVCGVYFSPAGTTRTVVAAAAEAAAETLGVPVRLSFAESAGGARESTRFSGGNACLCGCADLRRTAPNKISPDLHRILRGNGTPVAAIVTYGNRAYENALAELSALLAENGFQPAAGAACVCRHSSARALGGRTPERERPR